MEFSSALFLNAVVSGLLLAGFYAAVAVGISISFGMLDVVNIAHPGFIILGSYIALMINQWLGIDPILVSVVLSPVFFLLGIVLYRIYYLAFERRGQESLRGLAFFFGILFITEVCLILAFGVDYQLVQTAYSETTLKLGEVGFPLRLLVPCLVSVAMVVGLQFFLSHTFFGRAVLAVAQDQLALRIMGVNPVRVKQYAFAISIATGGRRRGVPDSDPARAAGDRPRVHRPRVCDLRPRRTRIDLRHAGRRGDPGRRRELHRDLFGPSWAPAVSFGLLLFTLAFRPTGLFGR